MAGKQRVRTQAQDRMGAADRAEAGNICKERLLEAVDICMSSGDMEAVQQAGAGGISSADTGRKEKAAEGRHTLAVQAVRNRAETFRTGWEEACTLLRSGAIPTRVPSKALSAKEIASPTASAYRSRNFGIRTS